MRFADGHGHVNTFEPETIELERRKVAASSAITKSLMRDATLKASDTVGLAVDQMILQLEAHVLANPAGRIVYSFPATLWDHAKARAKARLERWRGVKLAPVENALLWWLDRHPVREEAKAFSAAALFPEATIPKRPDGLGNRVVFYVEPELPDPSEWE